MSIERLRAIHGKEDAMYGDEGEPDFATFRCGAKAEADRATGAWTVVENCREHSMPQTDEEYGEQEQGEQDEADQNQGEQDEADQDQSESKRD